MRRRDGHCDVTVMLWLWLLGLYCLILQPILASEETNQEAVSWWRHQMETFFALLAMCAGNSPVPGEFPAQRPVTRSFDVFFDLRLNKRLSKQWWGWWFETLSRSLWRHCNGNSKHYSWNMFNYARRLTVPYVCLSSSGKSILVPSWRLSKYTNKFTVRDHMTSCELVQFRL